MEIVKVPYSKLDEYAILSVSSVISQADKVSKSFIVRFRNKQHLSTGNVSMNMKYTRLHLCEIVHISNYTGKLKPLSHSDHWREVNDGKRERGYIGRLISIDGQKYVIVNQIQLEPISGEEEEGQLALF
ncbi:hypothetical protein [Flectobacillus roseus]|uniref:hypothetical protein n=1 Tax=Flectobacillus roseus TaxID=502259 RepID=UPI0024B7F3B4|nr:hypothetical protein [Flectobacillus roseus]MDI9870596.1 hypothetical protein [Flectobacillus roseus]